MQTERASDLQRLSRSMEGVEATMDVAVADRLLSQIEVAIGEVTPRDAQNAALIKQIIESVNGLRSLLGVVRTH
jgi:hypothetical protein